MRQRNFLRLGSGDAIGGALAACGAQPVAAQPAPRTGGKAGIVRGWNALALRAIRDTRAGLDTATRALAALHTAMYNAWAAYDDVARQTAHGRAVRLPRAERSAASKAGAMSHAAYLVLCERFPSQQAGFEARMAAFGLAPARLDGQFTPAGIGRTQAIAVLEACGRDGVEDKRFESDAGSPDGWCRLAQQVSEREGYGDDRDVLLYFVLANALADALQVAGSGAVDAAVAVVLRSFTGSAEWRIAAGGTEDMESLELGRKAGAQAFAKARRCWRGKL
jgi:hypothetical protein